MFVLFLIVTLSVLAIMCMQCQRNRRFAALHPSANSPRDNKLSLGLTGLLSMALGIRVVALASALYAFPALAAVVRGDEPEQAGSTTNAEAPLSAAPADSTEVAPKQPGSTDNAEAPSSAAPAESNEVAVSTPIREPLKTVTNLRYLSKDRPDWLEDAPEYEDGDLKVVVRGGPFSSFGDCEQQLVEEVTSAVSQYVNQHLKSNYAATLISFSLDELRRRNVVREQFREQLETSQGWLMSQVHAQLVFDDKFRKEVDLRWSELRSRSRLAQTGLGAGVVLLLLGTMFSYFKVDTATKGYYTGRLQFATAGTILALVAASVVLAKLIPPM